MRPNGRTSQTDTINASATTPATETSPTYKVLRRAASTNWPKLCTGLPTDTAPMIWLFQRTGAPAYMTEVRGSSATSGVVRAPYSPRSASLTSRHCEKSAPVARPSESNSTRPVRSVTYRRISTLRLVTLKMCASKSRA